MNEGTGTRLRRAAASAELTARLTSEVLAAHIRSLPEGVRHHYLSPAPLPPEAEEAEEADGVMATNEPLTMAQVRAGLQTAATGAAAVPPDLTLDQVRDGLAETPVAAPGTPASTQSPTEAPLAQEGGCTECAPGGEGCQVSEGLPLASGAVEAEDSCAEANKPAADAQPETERRAA